MSEILKIAAVTKKFDKQFALSNVTFGLNEGEILGLVGPNGAGKTTLMKIIVGLTRNFEGKIICNVDRKIIAPAEKLFGCMIEAPKFYPYMSGYQNLKFFSSLNGKLNKKNLNDIVELMGLSNAVKKKVKTYSLGMKQRLGFAQALLNNPKILILDEPTNGLDPNGINEIRKYLQKIAFENKVSILISSHTLSEIEKICQRAVVLKKGKAIEIIDMQEKTYEDTIFAFETNETDEFLALLKAKNIVIEDVGEGIIKIRLPKEKLSSFIKDVVLKDINFTSVYEVRKSLEDKFLDLTGGNKIV
jgi:ABC-type multidrug transport system, ATPase component